MSGLRCPQKHPVKSIIRCDFHKHDDGAPPFLALEIEWEEIIDGEHSITWEPFDGAGISALPMVKTFMQSSANQKKIKKLQNTAMTIHRRERACDAFLAAQVFPLYSPVAASRRPFPYLCLPLTLYFFSGCRPSRWPRRDRTC